VYDSALLTGLGGALYPGRSAFATPDLMLWTVSGELIIMVMIGGLGTLAGPVIGGRLLRPAPGEVSSYVDWYFMVIGLVLIFIVLFMPRGLLGIASSSAAADGARRPSPGGRRRLQELRRARGAPRP